MPVFSRPLLNGCFLPTEIWDLVIDSADREDLATLSLVASSWRVRAQYRFLREFHIVAGPRCILWYTLRTSRGTTPFPKILPDTFQSLHSSFTKLSPRVRGLVKTVTFRGLSASERRMALELSMGYGEDPYITLCIIHSFTRLLPGVRVVNLSHVTWTTCLRSLLLPRRHRCVKDENKRDLDAISISTIDHGRLQDSVFDILTLTSSCPKFRSHDIGWDQHSLSTEQCTRLDRPDVRDFEVTMPFDYAGLLLARHLPVMKGLRTLCVRDISFSTYLEVARMLKRSAGTLEQLSLSLKEDCESAITYSELLLISILALSVEMWRDLPVLECRSLKCIQIRLILCEHLPMDSCAGTSTFPALFTLLPENIESLSVVVWSPIVAEEARRRIRTVPDWRGLIMQLQQLKRLRTVEIVLPAPEHEDNRDEPREFYVWKQLLANMLLPVQGNFSSTVCGPITHT
ncbi:hypothetical protein EIP86_002684 [Pleurotus ostreatoroseus]|nr:hypothetical protein EIP86_002684 [Pleurotus ostreatoroseus]